MVPHEWKEAVLEKTLSCGAYYDPKQTVEDMRKLIRHGVFWQ